MEPSTYLRVALTVLVLSASSYGAPYESEILESPVYQPVIEPIDGWKENVYEPVIAPIDGWNENGGLGHQLETLVDAVLEHVQSPDPHKTEHAEDGEWRQPAETIHVDKVVAPVPAHGQRHPSSKSKSSSSEEDGGISADSSSGSSSDCDSKEWARNIYAKKSDCDLSFSKSDLKSSSESISKEHGLKHGHKHDKKKFAL